VASEHENGAAAAVRQLAEAAAARVGVEVVEVHLHGGRGHRLVRVDVDRAGASGVNLDDCQAISAALGDAIEAAGLIEDHYTLEVSSPGLDRPIRTSDDVRRNTGRRVVVETQVAVAGKRTLRGVLAGQSGTDWIVEEDDGKRHVVAAENVAIARQDVPF
jgi:ribosome maturation factor RimP